MRTFILSAAFVAASMGTSCGGEKTVVGQPCPTAGEELCEGTALIRCDGTYYRELAACASDCVAEQTPTVHDVASLTADETWSCAASPHVVTTTVFVSGATLTLEAGALLRLQAATRIETDVAGRIDSLGVAEAPVLVTSDSGAAGGFGNSATGGLNVFAVRSGEPSRIEPSRIEHTIIERGIHGLGVLGLAADATPPVVFGSTFRDNEGFGVFITCDEDDPPIPAFADDNDFFNNGDGDVSSCQP